MPAITVDLDPTSTAPEAAPLALGIQAMRPAQGASPARAERGE